VCPGVVKPRPLAIGRAAETHHCPCRH
jgi:hypothetical protein